MFVPSKALPECRSEQRTSVDRRRQKPLLCALVTRERVFHPGQLQSLVFDSVNQRFE
jgi:hypothetical protein